MSRADSSIGSETGFARKRSEDSIPVVEIRGEGKPMTPAQIRALEEASNGGPLDIKVGTMLFIFKYPQLTHSS